jgi:hypothetical protein
MGFKPTSELNGSMLYRDVDAEQPEGYADKRDGNDLWNVRKATTSKAWSSVILQDCALEDASKSRLGKAWYDRGVGVRVSMLPEPDTTVFAGKPPYGGKRGKDRMPETGGATLIVRRKTEDTTFVALHEPFEGGPAKAPTTRFQRIAQDPAKGLAVRVTGDGPVNDRVLMQLGDDLSQPVTLAGGGESFTFQDYGFIRVSKASVQVWGNVSAMTLKVDGSPKLLVNGQAVPATVQDGVLSYPKN